MDTSKSIRIGCSGFYNAHWKNIFYPETLPKNQWLNFYGEHFNTLEINSTFYQFPRIANLTTWYHKTPEDFLFSVKAPKLITHLNKFNDCAQLMEDFYSVCEEGLKNKLGCLLFQLPPSIPFSEEKLQQIVHYLKPGFKNVVEFRHESWWAEQVYSELTKHQIVFSSINHPKLPNKIVSNTKTVYLRLHGNPEIFYSNYTTEFLTKLHSFLHTRESLHEIFIYFNNTASTSGVQNAQELKKIFQSEK